MTVADKALGGEEALAGSFCYQDQRFAPTDRDFKRFERVGRGIDRFVGDATCKTICPSAVWAARGTALTTAGRASTDSRTYARCFINAPSWAVPVCRCSTRLTGQSPRCCLS